MPGSSFKCLKKIVAVAPAFLPSECVSARDIQTWVRSQWQNPFDLERINTNFSPGGACFGRTLCWIKQGGGSFFSDSNLSLVRITQNVSWFDRQDEKLLNDSFLRSSFNLTEVRSQIITFENQDGATFVEAMQYLVADDRFSANLNKIFMVSVFNNDEDFHHVFGIKYSAPFEIYEEALQNTLIFSERSAFETALGEMYEIVIELRKSSVPDLMISAFSGSR